MTWTLKYKLPGQLFWRRIRRVKANFIKNNVWVIILATEEQIVLPITAAIYAPATRYQAIKAKMDAEAGQVLPIQPQPE